MPKLFLILSTGRKYGNPDGIVWQSLANADLLMAIAVFRAL